MLYSEIKFISPVQTNSILYYMLLAVLFHAVNWCMKMFSSLLSKRDAYCEQMFSVSIQSSKTKFWNRRRLNVVFHPPIFNHWKITVGITSPVLIRHKYGCILLYCSYKYPSRSKHQFPRQIKFTTCKCISLKIGATVESDPANLRLLIEPI